ncbi:DUF805 domain-containing protein [Bradyrhizobium sp. AUGA SZCCT0240]|uniref:DUF805 domain-containing protein n=1 Tax=unclassified Bradyrhizobium TaxID=2631580 RepID=UPI001BAAAFD3|nr:MULTISPECIES: DUF805 domain-containing protein [unclassified Bradyrhizobium]MBR1195407.1 DUF805 domain-containing protein [Bradyrhizobium sp. AUGA SZCCT0158]MBR1242189.1 DUF805 domain-containing protein [Bradyrhizobium sp. AUGA SZCCT0274]MBR1256828.1 DUF805 domain-containing protein [Bradyrhizobium sp. AUGA SZCCT0240]
MDYARLLFSFNGRINRARYLAVQLALLTFWLVLWLKSPFGQWEVLQASAVIAMLWINAATTAKRLHDRNRSGWWAIAVLIVNPLSYVYYALFFGLYFGVDVSAAREMLLVMGAVALSVLQTWMVIELFFLIGTDGRNRFGTDPTRNPPKLPIMSHPQSFGVPDFLLHRAGPVARG